MTSSNTILPMVGRFSIGQQIEAISDKIAELYQQIRPLYHTLLSEEASRILGRSVKCVEISDVLVSHYKHVRHIEFVDENDVICAKLVDYYCDNELETVECFVLGMDDEEARDFMLDMKDTVDWSYF